MWPEPDDDDGLVLEREPEREAICTVSIIRRDQQDLIRTTVPVCAPGSDHDQVVAEMVADIVADELGMPAGELVGLAQPSTPAGPEVRGMGWVMGPDERQRPHAGRTERARAWWAADALDVSWLETEYLPSQW